MTEELASIIWDELKRYINVVDRSDAAENLIGILIDNDCDPNEIKSAFKNDSEFKKALSSYLSSHDEEEEDIEEELEEEDIEDWDE
jgi:hypothetical protein